MWKWLLIVPGALGLLAVMAGQMGFLRGTAPADLGARDGKLKAPSTSPNSVSSQADLWPGHPQATAARIEPLPLVADGEKSGAATLARLQAIVQATPGAQLVTVEPAYLYATFTTPLMKYTDDVEFLLDAAAGVVHVRSASRIGRSDLGANRQRIEAIRAQLAKQTQQAAG